MSCRGIARLATLLGTLLFASAPSSAQPSGQVDLELVLLADATGSIDAGEIRFQREGYARAIADPAVLSAIAGGIHGRIAVTYVEWGHAESQDVVAGWTVIDGKAAADGFAEALLAPPRRAFGRNAIGAALLFGKALIDENAIQGTRRVIDLSADSANNWNGPAIFDARDIVVKSGIVINGLAVLCRHCSGRPANYDLEAAFAERIIGGPGSFVITADDRTTFAEAVRRKLILEIAGSAIDPLYESTRRRIADAQPNEEDVKNE
ncbi:DUF1194 domain-containing protein [Stappia sp. F7233]|uniref:DUF1194 domain-containing protein n=1 Tax=Stappia albiluteola TaxID=2758565 RepID=A0A839AHG4_9HYPH|nr:DUF1194 domain-containing protein [Stappia albiluteola]MBA5778575.1 DUF1194 domain-containing protein [Stappia albiluteola]